MTDGRMSEPPNEEVGVVPELLTDEPTKRDELVAELAQALTAERDARREDQFIFVVVCILLLNVILFAVMSSFGGPVAFLILVLLILIPLARRMGVQEITEIMSRTLGRVADQMSRTLGRVADQMRRGDHD